MGLIPRVLVCLSYCLGSRFRLRSPETQVRRQRAPNPILEPVQDQVHLDLARAPISQGLKNISDLPLNWV